MADEKTKNFLIDWGFGDLVDEFKASYITQCKLKDPQLNKCIMAAMEQMRPHFAEGIPEMKLPAFYPFHLDKITLKTRSIILELTNVSFIGFMKVQVDDVGIDLGKNLVTGKFSLSQLGLRGTYSLNGNLVAMALHASGYHEIDFYDLRYEVEVRGKREKKNGKEYVDFDQIENEVQAADVKFRFDDLFKDNPEMTARTNEVLNENSKVILKDFKKLVEEAMGSIVLAMLKTVFETFSLDELFL